MKIIGCSNSKKLAERVANTLKIEYSHLEIRNAHNGEMHIKFNTSINNETILLFQSLYPHPNHSLLELLFAAETAKDLKAKKIILVLPYFAFLTEEYRLEHGECVGSKVISSILNKTADEIITIDPHQDLSKLFTIPIHAISTAPLIKKYIEKNFISPYVLIAPDENAKNMLNNTSLDFLTLNKKRIDEYNVKISDSIELENKDAILIDDMINTGTTMSQAIKSLKSKHNVYCITVHPVLAGNAEKLLEKTKIISTNTITHHTNQIDVAPLLVDYIKEKL